MLGLVTDDDDDEYTAADDALGVIEIDEKKSALDSAPDADPSIMMAISQLDNQIYYSGYHKTVFFKPELVLRIIDALKKSKQKGVPEYLAKFASVDEALGEDQIHWVDVNNPQIQDPKMAKLVWLTLNDVELLREMEDLLPSKVQDVEQLLDSGAMDAAAKYIENRYQRAIYLGAFDDEMYKQAIEIVKESVSEGMQFMFLNPNNVHWVTLIIDHESETIEYLDSFGDRPDGDIYVLIRLISRKYKDYRMQVWRRKVQFGTTQCGMFSLVFTEIRAAGKTIKELSQEFTARDSDMRKLRYRYFRLPIKHVKFVE